MQSSTVKTIFGKVQEKVAKQCRKANDALKPLSKDHIAEHMGWHSEIFERQERINKARCQSISSIRGNYCALSKELAAQKKINQTNSKRIQALEKILKLKPPPIIEEVVHVPKNEPNGDDDLVLPELPTVPTKPILKAELKEESTELNDDAPTNPIDDAENQVPKKKISFHQKCRRVFSRKEKKWIVSHECIGENIEWADQMFDRQETINKIHKVGLSKLNMESRANRRDLTAQSVMKGVNTRKIDALEKLLSAKGPSAENLITKDVQTVVVPEVNKIEAPVVCSSSEKKVVRFKEPSAENIITKDVQTVVVPVVTNRALVLRPYTTQVVDPEAKNCYPIKLNRSSVTSPKHYHIPPAPKIGKATAVMWQDQPRPWVRENGKWVPSKPNETCDSEVEE